MMSLSSVNMSLSPKEFVWLRLRDDYDGIFSFRFRYYQKFRLSLRFWYNQNLSFWLGLGIGVGVDPWVELLNGIGIVLILQVVMVIVLLLDVIVVIWGCIKLILGIFNRK